MKYSRTHRSLKRAWSDSKPFNRRVRWYENTDLSGITKSRMPYRLEFTDEFSQIHRFFTTQETTDYWFERFITLSNERPFKPVPGTFPPQPSGENVSDSPVRRIEVEIDTAQAEGK